MRETAYDEQRDTEQERQILFLTGESYGGRHDESASYTEKAAFKRTCTESQFQNLLR